MAKWYDKEFIKKSVKEIEEQVTVELERVLDYSELSIEEMDIAERCIIQDLIKKLNRKLGK